MGYGRCSDRHASNIRIRQNLIYLVGEVYRGILGPKLIPRIRVEVADPRKRTEIVEVPNQVFSPIAATDAGDFISEGLHHIDIPTDDPIMKYSICRKRKL